MRNEILGHKEACKILEANLTPRAKALRSLESYVDGTQYAGLPDFFSDKKPLWERAPCIVYPIVKSAIDSNGALLLGEGRFPSVTVAGLSGDEATKFEEAVKAVVQQSRLRAAAREVFASGQGCGSACAVFGVRNTRLFIDTVHARWATPTIGTDGAVHTLEIKYPYLDLVQTPDGWKYVCKLYRRIIDNISDTTFFPGEAKIEATEPVWVEDPLRTIKHELGFCPVVWFAHLKGCSVVNDFDGRALHEHLTDEIRAHDFALSQRHRAALYAGDPQWTEIGVKPGYNPTGTGHRANVPASQFGRPGTAEGNSYISEPPDNSKARKKSPGTVWQYEGKCQEVKVDLHCLPGDALTAIDNHAKDLRLKLAEALGVVFMDPESLPNESRISGRALESFKARQLDRVDDYRLDFGDRFLNPALGMLLRIADKVGLRIAGLDAIRAQAAKTSQWSWLAPPLDFTWGDYFKLTGEDEELMIRGQTEALTAGIATKKSAVEKLRSVLGIKDVDSYMKELETERVATVKHAGEMAKAVAPPTPPVAAKGPSK